MRRCSLFVFFLVPVFSTICFAQVRPRPGQRKAPATPPAFMQQLKSFDRDGSVTKVVLKNDLTILVGEMHAMPLAEILTWVKSGTGDDPDDLSGAARVMQNLLWKGTENRTAAILGADLKALGAVTRSDVSYDHASLAIEVPAPQWKRALSIQADMVLHPLFESGEIKRQVDDVRTAAGYEQSDETARARARLLASGFAGSRLARGGEPSALPAGITREKLLNLYRSTYAPGRMILVICGDVTAAEVLDAAVDLYASAKGGAAASRTGVATAEGFHYEQLRGDIAQGQLLLGFHTAAWNSSDFPALRVLRAMLTTGESSVLNRRLKYGKNIALGTGGYEAFYDDTGFLELSFDLQPGDMDRCEIAAFTEFEILKGQDPDPAGLARAQAQLVREFWESLSTVSGRADLLARYESLGSWKGLDGYLSRLGQVKWADVARIASKYLRLDNCAVIESLPQEAEPRNLTAETLRTTLHDLLAPSVEQETAEREKETVPAADIPETAPAFSPTELRYEFQMASILRGPALFIREDHQIPYVNIGLYFAGGKADETEAGAGITALMLHTMLRDSKNRSAEQIYRQLELYGGKIVPVVQDDYFGVRLSVSSSCVEQGLDLLSEMIKSPKFDAEEIARQKRFQEAELRGLYGRGMVLQLVRGSLFPDHSYGRGTLGSAAGLAAITPDSIRAWYQERVADRRPMIAIIGDTQGTSLASYFVRNFSGSRFQDVKTPSGFVKALGAPAAVEKEWARSRSLLTIAFQAPPEGDEDSFALTVFRDFAVGLTSPLGDYVREKVPSASAVRLEYRPEPRGGSILASFTVAPGDEEAARKAFSESIGRLLTETISYRDYRSALNAAVAAVQIAQQDRYGQIEGLIRWRLSGQELDTFQDFVNLLQDVRQADLQEVAGRVLRFDKSVTVLLHGKSRESRRQ